MIFKLGGIDDYINLVGLMIFKLGGIDDIQGRSKKSIPFVCYA